MMDIYILAILYDLYGNMLTQKQSEALDLYINEDMTLSELSDYLNITRQGVRDNIQKATVALQKLENRLGFYRKQEMRNKAAEEVLAVLGKTGHDEAGGVFVTKEEHAYIISKIRDLMAL